MHLIVDSGSTKSDWVIVNGENRFEYHTIGLNPHFHDEDSVYKVVSENLELLQFKANITNVFFYGAGCSSDALNSIIENGLKRVFTNAKIIVDHDLKACVFATYEGKPAISCVLGTGSNACFFDGKILVQNKPSLGYILGDEGSGAYFGKQLLQDFLYKELPSNMDKALRADYNLDKANIFKHVYHTPNANGYLASYMKFIFQYANEQYVKHMLNEGFKKFVQLHVCCNPDYKTVKTHFIGSIAYYFSDELKQACDFYGVQIGQILQKPINGLVNFHLKNPNLELG